MRCTTWCRHCGRIRIGRVSGKPKRRMSKLCTIVSGTMACIEVSRSTWAEMHMFGWIRCHRSCRSWSWWCSGVSCRSWSWRCRCVSHRGCWWNNWRIRGRSCWRSCCRSCWRRTRSSCWCRTRSSCCRRWWRILEFSLSFLVVQSSTNCAEA